MIKLIASDLDGTLLLNGAQKLTEEAYGLISALKEKGILFVAASGRPLTSQKLLFGPIADEISYIAENGAVYAHGNQIVTTNEIDRELALEIAEAVDKKTHCRLIVSSATTTYLKSGDENFLHHVRDVLRYHTVVVDDFSMISEPIVKLAFWTPSDPNADAIDLRERFSSRIKVMTSGKAWVDFMPYETNKGSALKILSKQLGIQPEEILAFGDEENDVEMLDFAGTGYAMSTAKETVKTHADYLTDSVESILRTLI